MAFSLKGVDLVCSPVPGHRVVGPATACWRPAIYPYHLLLHNKEEGSPMAQTFGVKMWGQHIGVVDQGTRQQWDRGSEGAKDTDDVWVRGQLFSASL